MSVRNEHEAMPGVEKEDDSESMCSKTLNGAVRH